MLPQPTLTETAEKLQRLRRPESGEVGLLHDEGVDYVGE